MPQLSVFDAFKLAAAKQKAEKEKAAAVAAGKTEEEPIKVEGDDAAEAVTPTTSTAVANATPAPTGAATPATAPAATSGADLVSPSDAAISSQMNKRLRIDVDADDERKDATGAPVKCEEEDANATDNEKEEKEAEVKKEVDDEASSKRQRKGETESSVRATRPAVLDITKADVASVTATTMAQLLQKKKFQPYAFEGWPEADNAKGAPYAYLADVLADISSVSGRLDCTVLLTHFFWTIMERSPADLLPAIYLVVNKQAPAHEGVELGIGDGLLVKVVAEVCGMKPQVLREEYAKTGDLAEIAQTKKGKVATLMKPKPLYLSEVFKLFKDIATASGKDSQLKRTSIIKRMMRDSKGAETNFLIRALQGKMRIGVAENTVFVALGYAIECNLLGAARIKKMELEELQAHLQLAAEQVARCFHEVPSFDIVIPYIVAHGLPRHDQPLPTALSIRPGLPVRPMLAHPTTGIKQVLDRFDGKKFTCEYKYDGERAQIHYVRGAASPFSIFSRNSETHTSKYPDIIQMLPTVFNPDTKIDSFIIDSEAVAVGPDGELQAFQVLQHRGRKGVDLSDVKIPVCVFAFDLLYLNGEPVLHKTLEERRVLLEEMFIPDKRKLLFATRLNTDDTEEVQEFLGKSITDGCEGLMLKTLTEDAAYHPAKRSYSWLKLKKDYMDGCGDTLDLVPIGAYFGKGKRTGVYGGFLLACYDAENDEYQSVCKIGTGFKEADLEEVTKQLQAHVTPSQPRCYLAHENFKPDVWFQECAVWEVKAADLSISPVHKAGVGLVHPEKGIALRFPRFIKRREDKQPTEATSAAQVAEMYKAQALATGGAPPAQEEE